jgi:hypothetical protein
VTPSSPASVAAEGHEDVAVAQLHYTVMLHLGRAFDLRKESLDRYAFFEVLVRLTSRVTAPTSYSSE